MEYKYNQVIREFGSLLEELHGKGAEPRLYYPETTLPKPMDEIYLALVSELLNLVPENKVAEADALLQGLFRLSMFLPDDLAKIGNEKLVGMTNKLKLQDPDAYMKLVF